MTITKSIILLSGGLDSLVSLALTKEKFNVELALIFDYGQKSVKKEIEASEKICKHYNIKHKVIKLDWLKKITQTSLVSEKEIPKMSKKDLLSFDSVCESAKAVWVPNRNGLFLNIAGCFADSFGYDYIIFGANKEEGLTFPDNTKKFTEIITQEFGYSTLNHPKVLAPLINSDKNDIVKLAIKHDIPLKFTRSCYSDSEKNCGTCESCIRLKRVLEINNCSELIRDLF